MYTRCSEITYCGVVESQIDKKSGMIMKIVSNCSLVAALLAVLAAYVIAVEPANTPTGDTHRRI